MFVTSYCATVPPISTGKQPQPPPLPARGLLSSAAFGPSCSSSLWLDQPLFSAFIPRRPSYGGLPRRWRPEWRFCHVRLDVRQARALELSAPEDGSRALGLRGAVAGYASFAGQPLPRQRFAHSWARRQSARPLATRARDALALTTRALGNALGNALVARALGGALGDTLTAHGLGGALALATLSAGSNRRRAALARLVAARAA